MPAEPQILLMPYARRRRFFWLLALVFVITLPLLIFYTTGYRLAFVEDEPVIVTTGGMYVSTLDRDVEVFLNEVRVENPRLFRSAYYIQNIAAGKHRVVVQQEGYHTWVKELPVDPYMVTEAAAFNVPVVPRVRPITRYLTATGTPVVRAVDGLDPYRGVSSTVAYIVATTSATSTLILNPEYGVLEQMFSTTTPTTTSVFATFFDNFERFRFATTSTGELATVTEPVSVVAGDVELRVRERDIFAVWNGAPSRVPHYFCVASSTQSIIAARYGEHVADALEEIKTSTTTSLLPNADGQLCRPEIKLDRKRMDVFFYDFFPNSSDLVLLRLEDGLHVVEIDDRSWQNTQKIFSGTDFRVIVEGGRIFILEANRFFELETSIADTV